MLENKIIKDLLVLGLHIDFNLQIKGYSKTFNGRYDPNNQRVIIYTLNEDGSSIDYNTIIKTVIHESIHHLQWVHDKQFKRVEGIMHNKGFKELESYYNNIALEKGVIKC